MAGEIQLNSTTLATESSGAITLSNVDSATNRTNLGLGSIATQEANSVDIDGGAIDGATIGGTTPAAGTFTTFTSTGIDDNASGTALTIDSNGSLLVGTATTETRFGFTPELQVEGTGANAGIAVARYSNDNTGPVFIFSKSRGTSVGSDTIVANNSILGAIYFAGADGTDQSSTGASIVTQVDGTPGLNDMPGRLVFATTADGASSPTERMRIDSSGAVSIVGSLSKGSGSFKIDHPLPEKADTHHLVHSFVEAPQADLIYRGKVDLVDGSATVNIDTATGMTEGTFVALNREVQCFTSNESGWTNVRGSVSGNILTIEAEDNNSSDTISWLVIGERQDQHMHDTEWTDENGKVIVEPLKEIEAQEATP